MDHEQTQITIDQNKNQQLEEQVPPISSKRMCMRFERLFAQTFDQNPIQ
jgi:hypothetical protein